MKLVWKVALGGLGLIALAAAGLGGFIWSQTSAYAASMAQVYDVPLPAFQPSDDPSSLARGKHLTHSIGSCAAGDCHGADLAGGKTLEMGPIGTLSGPNITSAGLGSVYTEAELVRLIQHGIKRGGTSLTFMPVHEVNWLSDADVQAIARYVKSVPAVERPNGPLKVGLLGKILDRRDALVLDVARRIDHAGWERAPAPAPTAEYGRFISLLCTGCHGHSYSGGPIPGAPSSLPIPTNITPHASGLADWTFEDFTRLLDEGKKKNGETLNPFMPLDSIRNMDEIERKALWEFLRTLPPKEFGNR